MPGYNTVTVTTSATQIVGESRSRRSIIIVNTDTASNLYIGPDASVTTSNGILVGVNGGTFTEDSGGLAVYTGPIYGVSTGSIDVRYWERG